MRFAALKGLKTLRVGSRVRILGSAIDGKRIHGELGEVVRFSSIGNNPVVRTKIGTHPVYTEQCQPLDLVDRIFWVVSLFFTKLP